METTSTALLERVAQLALPDKLEAPLAESYPEVLTAYSPDARGLSNGHAVNPHHYLLEVGPACIRVRKKLASPAEDWHKREALGPGPVLGQGELEGIIPPPPEPEKQPSRQITEWSRQSRRNMIRTLATLDWQPFLESGIPEMVTLTYPNDWRSCGGDGTKVKAHLKAFRNRWERKFGSPPVGIWKLEFQARGAPHLHLYLARPTRTPEALFRSWISTTWYEVVGSNDPLHLKAGTGVDRQFVARAADLRRLCAYFSKHNSKWGTKSYQNDVPPDFQAVGRFWGIWTLKPDLERVELTRQDYNQVNRMLRQLQRSARKGRKIKCRGGETGLWTLTHDGPKVATQMARWLRERPP